MKRKQLAERPGKLGDTLVSSRKTNNGGFVTVADVVEKLVTSEPGLTEAEIAKELFANKAIVSE